MVPAVPGIQEWNVYCCVASLVCPLIAGECEMIEVSQGMVVKSTDFTTCPEISIKYSYNIIYDNIIYYCIWNILHIIWNTESSFRAILKGYYWVPQIDTSATRDVDIDRLKLSTIPLMPPTLNPLDTGSSVFNLARMRVVHSYKRYILYKNTTLHY